MKKAEPKQKGNRLLSSTGKIGQMIAAASCVRVIGGHQEAARRIPKGMAGVLHVPKNTPRLTAVLVGMLKSQGHVVFPKINVLVKLIVLNDGRSHDSRVDQTLNGLICRAAKNPILVSF
jgi:hypothetical protein